MKDDKLYPTIKDCMTFEECKDGIVFISIKIRDEYKSKPYVKHRIKSLRSLLDLIEQYENNADKIRSQK